MTHERNEPRPTPFGEAGFIRCFHAHFVGVQRFVSRQLRGDRGEVDDVCSEVFRAAAKRFPELAGLPEPAVRAWLIRTARNACLHRYRSRFRRDRVLGRVPVPPDSYDPFEEDGGAMVDASILCNRVRDVISDLPEAQRQLLILDLEGGATGTQIAGLLGISEVAARLRLMRAPKAFAAAYLHRFGAPFSTNAGDGDANG